MLVYKGVFIYGEKGKYTCDLFTFPEQHPFRTLKEIKNYIKDYKENEY